MSTDDSASRSTLRGFGLAASVPIQVIQRAAAEAETTGYASFWLNNPPHARALEPLGTIAGSVPSIHLGVGVIPVSEHPAAVIVTDVLQNRLPQDRFYLGIGSGSGPRGVDRVADAVHAIRAQVACAIVVAALGPRMCRLAGAEADGVLLNWLTPNWAARSVEWIADGARLNHRPAPRVMAYVRTAMGTAAMARLEEEAARYESIGAYADHFKRMGVSAYVTTVTGDSPDMIQEGLALWNGVVDEVIVRAITADDTDDAVSSLLHAARPPA